MFDPLSFYTSAVAAAPRKSLGDARVLAPPSSVADHGNGLHEELPPSPVAEPGNGLDEDVPPTAMDLPNVRWAEPQVILDVLRLLRPPEQTNFHPDEQSDMPHEPGFDPEGIMQYYRQWGGSRPPISSHAHLRSKLRLLLNRTGNSEGLLRYYTTVVSYFADRDPSSEQIQEILRQASLRIAEQCGRTAQPAMTRRFRVPGVDHDIFIHEPALTSDNLGLKTWGASLALSQRILSLPSCTNVLELGSGTGLVGISYALAHTNFCSVFLTDLPHIVPNLQRNIDLNSLSCNVVAAALDWSDHDGFRAQKSHPSSFDLILIADPLYSPEHPSLVVRTVDAFLAPAGYVHLQIPARPQYSAERRRLWDLFKDFGFDVIYMEEKTGTDDWGEVTYIYAEIRRRCRSPPHT